MLPHIISQDIVKKITNWAFSIFNTFFQFFDPILFKKRERSSNFK